MSFRSRTVCVGVLPEPVHDLGRALPTATGGVHQRRRSTVVEMGSALTIVVSRLRDHSSYVRMFSEAFHQPPSDHGLARALASYIRVIRSGDAPLDLHRAGDTTALDDAARRGLAIFAEVGCSQCHSGANFTDEDFHNTGVSRLIRPGRRWPGLQSDTGRFNTPTLRDVARTAPYMHDGRLRRSTR